MSADKKFCGAQLRLLVVIEILSGNEVFGVCLKDVAEALGKSGHKVSTSTVLHDLEALEAGRWAERISDQGQRADAGKQWRLSVKPYQILNNLTWGLQSAARQVSETQHNYSRLAV